MSTAAAAGNLEMVRYLVEELGYPIDAVSSHDPPLVAAAGQGRLDVMRYLLDKGANLSVRGMNTDNAVERAVANQQFAALELLLSRGGLASTGDEGARALAMAMNTSCRREYDALVEAGAIPVAWDQAPFMDDSFRGYLDSLQQGAELLVEAVLSGDAARARQLVAGGISPDATNRMHLRPMEVAAGVRDAVGVSLLLDLGADPNLPCSEGRALISSAARIPDNGDVLRVLVKQGGVRLNDPAMAEDGYPLTMACTQYQGLKNVQVLLSLGAEINAFDDFNGAFLTAVAMGNLEMVRYLLARGADPLQLTSEGSVGGRRNALYAATAHDSIFHFLRSLPGLDGPIAVIAPDLVGMFDEFASVEFLSEVLAEGGNPNGAPKELLRPTWELTLACSDAEAKLDLLLSNGLDVRQEGSGSRDFLGLSYAYDPECLWRLLRRHSMVLDTAAIGKRNGLLQEVIRREDVAGMRFIAGHFGSYLKRGTLLLQTLGWAMEMTPCPEKDSIVDMLLGMGVAKEGRLPGGRTLLMKALEEGDSAWVSRLLERGYDPRAVDDVGAPVLFHLVDRDRLLATAEPRASRLRLVKALVAAGADGDVRDSRGRSLLHAAAEANDLGVAGYCLSELGLGVTEVTDDGLTALGAVLEEELLAETWFDRYERDLRQKNGSNGPPVVGQRLQQRLPMVKFLVEAGSPLTWGVAGVKSVPMHLYGLSAQGLVRDCVANGYSPNHHTEAGSLLGMAVMQHDVDMVFFLMANGADPRLPGHIAGRELEDLALSSELRMALGL